MALFPDYSPTYSINKRSEPRMRALSFGDGYQQRVTFGLNQNPKQYDLEFILKEADAQILEDFLDARAQDCASFDWIAPDDTASKKWICPSWTREFLGPAASRIQLSLIEVFEP